MRFDYPQTPAVKRNHILELVCIEFGVTLNDLKGKKKLAVLADARKAYAYLMRKHTNETLQRIGAEINRDHPNIIHIIVRVEELISVGDLIKEQIENIEKQLLN